jgi:GT2 family glycosyltransferase
MIAFGVAVTKPKTYERFAAPGICRAAEPDSVVLAHRSSDSLFRNYNRLLDQAGGHEDLEALVLIHQDVEIFEGDFAARVRDALTDPDVAIVGCVGAVEVDSPAWFRGTVAWAAYSHHYEELGGGEFDSLSWRPEATTSRLAPGEVDAIDGLAMVLSPWAVRELRFDESLGQFHGYDFDICMQARAAGKKVVTADFRVIHHHSLELISDPEAWIAAYIRLAEKWADHLPGAGADPKQRALRAEAEAACAVAVGQTHWLRARAMRRKLDRAEQELESTRDQLRELGHETKAAAPTATTSKRGESAQAPSRAQTGMLPPGKARAIDYAVEHLGIESFASVEGGPAYGQGAFYTIDRPTVQRGALVDLSPRRARGQLLSTIEQAAERPGMRVLDGAFSDPRTVTEIGQVDAMLFFDVLLRMVDPDWDQVLELYAPATSCFVIANPQWERGEATVRLIDLGREKYLEAVPPAEVHSELFDRLDEWHPGQDRPYRDITGVWQWGITDADLKAKLGELGFSLEREWSLNRHPTADGFVINTFVFSRSQP